MAVVNLVVAEADLVAADSEAVVTREAVPEAVTLADAVEAVAQVLAEGVAGRPEDSVEVAAGDLAAGQLIRRRWASE